MGADSPSSSSSSSSAGTPSMRDDDDSSARGHHLHEPVSGPGPGSLRTGAAHSFPHLHLRLHHAEPGQPTAAPLLAFAATVPPPPPPTAPGHHHSYASSQASPSQFSTPPPPKKKQKRNKPTLSCRECVERKTKCDRQRPQCVACIKRQSECRYSAIADLIASEEHGGTRKTPRSKKAPKTPVGDGSHAAIPLHVNVNVPATWPPYKRSSAQSASSSPFLLSNIPYSNQTQSPFFGLGSEHPFANYWTSRGGLAEVIGVLPAKDQADVLVAKYFDAVDPVYPMIHRRNFIADYNQFWSLPLEGKQAADPVLVALHFVVYAMGTQFTHSASDQERAQIAEFYVSASQQALRLSSYLSRASVRTLQAMVLISYFLMNDNHASDAWAFGGILMRQAYAMGLHRDPDIISPRCSLSDKQQRRKLWQAVLFQDTFLTVLLKLPPSATFSDVRVESLTDELEDSITNGVSPNGASDTIVNIMSISSIAPMSNPFPDYELSDRQYIRSMWYMANLVQNTVCNPRSLNHPISTSSREKAALVVRYKELQATFPTSLTTAGHIPIANLAQENPRRLRQNFFFRSNFWHCVMIVQADENEDGSMKCDVKGALDAARMALAAFFDFWTYLRIDASVWWVFQHRAFEEALLMARILGSQQSPLSPTKSGRSPAFDPLFAAAKEDVRRTLEILEVVGGTPELQKTRTEVLRKAWEEIAW